MKNTTKIVNVFNHKQRKIRCIANELDYLGDGTMFKWDCLEIGREYTIKSCGADAIGLMVHLKEIPEDDHGYGFHSCLFEELKEYDKAKKVFDEMANFVHFHPLFYLLNIFFQILLFGGEFFRTFAKKQQKYA